MQEPRAATWPRGSCITGYLVPGHPAIFGQVTVRQDFPAQPAKYYNEVKQR